MIMLAFLLTGMAAQAQLGFSYHQSNITSAFGISTNPDKTLWAEARVSTANTFQFDVTGMLLVNFVKREDFTLYSGAGYGSLIFGGNVTFALGFTIKPIEKKPNFALFGEYSPLVPDSFDDFIPSGAVGIRYFLRKK